MRGKAASPMSPVWCFKTPPARGCSPCPIAARSRRCTDLVAGQIDMMIEIRSPPYPRRAPDDQDLRRGVRHKAAPRRPMSRPWMKLDCPDTTFRCGMDLWVPRGAPKPIIERIQAATVDALADPGTRAKLADGRAGDFSARAADAGGATNAAKGRYRKMVADHQGRQHQDGMSGCVTGVWRHGTLQNAR